jgi:hypothetical protein
MVLVSVRFVRGAQTGCSLESSRPAVLGIPLHSQSMSLPQRAGVKRMSRRGEAGEDRLQIHVFYTLNAASLRHTWTFRSPVDRRRISLLSAFRRDESKQKSSSLQRLPFFGPPSQPKPTRPQEVRSKQILRKIEGVFCSCTELFASRRHVFTGTPAARFGCSRRRCPFPNFTDTPPLVSIVLIACRRWQR